METDDGRKLFVGGLPDVISEDVLRQLFEATGGSVVDISLPRDRNTGRPRGFAFVTMSSAAEAEAARRSLDRSSQAGRTISVREFHSEPRQGGGGGGGGAGGPGPSGDRPRRERPEGPRGGPPDRNNDKTLYVSNLPYDASREELEGLFSGANAGSVARIHLPTTPDGRGRGFGFVTMDTTEAAEQAVVLMRDAALRGRKLHLSIAHPRGDRPPRPPGERGGAPDRGDRSDRPERPQVEYRGAGDREFAPERPRFEEPAGEAGPPPDRFESFRGGGEDRRRKEREKKKKTKQPKRGARNNERSRDNPSRWDRDSWDDD